ncbi:MAG: Transcription-repair-coupling factor [Alphaproteobacteria bacterium MarineAlpha9_Bin3]|nr:MAG: Transcription-repair-coupling factor [Alphaproteobacteria bacterium MarineAlpha9_Bin3]|tara:strand:- start:7951 stop:10947 length:2997 start_codon:yes stop_codon:yes gene_type:complete
MDIGEIAVRGGIIDIYTPNYTEPIRIDFFGDEVDQLKFFDPLTQLTKESINEVLILPTSEVLLNEYNINAFKNNYRKVFGSNSSQDDLFQAISNGDRYPGLEHWASLFYPKLESIFDILENNYSYIFDSSFDNYCNMRFDDINDYYNTRNITYKESIKCKNLLNCYKPLALEELYLSRKELEKSISNISSIKLSPFNNTETGNNLKGKSIPNFWLNKKIKSMDLFEDLISYIKSQIENGYKVIIACKSAGSRKVFSEQLNKYSISNIDFGNSWVIKNFSSNNIISLLIANFEKGFEIGNNIIISETDIFGKRYSKVNKSKKLETALQEAESFNIGDYLVHLEYGVGRYNGLKVVEINKVKHDCIELEYLSKDKLLIPVQNINLLSKFSSKDSQPLLDKLGSKSWSNKKRRAKEKIKDVAENLVRIASERKLGNAVKLTCDNNDFNDFISKFEYYETDDQLDAIKDVLKDINSDKPMDRLICGDVGFGKTEVAMRAAFVAVKSKTQVLVIAPTTILARQHYETFSNRFKDENISIAHLSRLTNSKEKNDITYKLKEGSIDIVIGTHSLLSNKILFNNLCLVVVDEEQRFGVSQKERLKNLTVNSHILTLTATPIPRTLHMALSGIRDLSIIASAPLERLPIRSFVTPFNDFNIKEGIQRELHRGGQVYFIVPRIKDIKDLEDKISSLIDNATISSIHGRMTPNEIENTMMNFYEGKINILIATSIIENGLDIPNANTIFIHNADMFGLGQLYQLKGRVGRSDRRAYAYYLLSDNRDISLNAEKRLYAIQSLEGLGAGFSLAAHDLDIRGAGNLLGDEQSGQIKEVGVSLYQQLLNEAVLDLKGKVKVKKDFSPQINLQAPALIPEDYILDLSIRLQTYRRLGNINNIKEFENFSIELIDRFGNIPKELNYLIKVMKIKLNCEESGILRIDSGINGATLEFINNGYIDPSSFMNWLEKSIYQLKIRNDQKLILHYKWNNIDERLDVIDALTNEIRSLSNI